MAINGIRESIVYQKVLIYFWNFRAPKNALAVVPIYSVKEKRHTNAVGEMIEKMRPRAAQFSMGSFRLKMK